MTSVTELVLNAGCFALSCAAFAGAVQTAPVDPVPNFVVEPKLSEAADFKPVESIDPFAWDIADGVLRRNGRPSFWLGNGVDLGSGQATPVGLWLAKLQGASAVATPHNVGWLGGKEDDAGVVHVSASATPGAYPWLREIVRLGFLAESCDTSGDATYCSHLSLMKRYPAFREVGRGYGHFRSLDTNHRVGREMIFAKRAPYWSYGAMTGQVIGELAREPGYDPDNARIKAGWRLFAKGKYKTVEALNAAWKTSYADFDGVDMPLLDVDGSRKGDWHRVRARTKELRDFPERYYDWLRFTQTDVCAATRGEAEDVRTKIPGLKLSMDFRGQQSSTDNYCVFDPALYDEFLDLVFTHNNGFRHYNYAGKAWDRELVYRQTGYTLLGANYFRNNTTRPLVDAENIVSRARQVGSTDATRRANDLAKFANCIWKETKLVIDRSKPRVDYPAINFETTFEIPAHYQYDAGDGSRRFYLCGYGMTASEHMFLNGRMVRYAQKKGDFWKADVTGVLKYGAKNDLKIQVNNDNTQTGLKPDCLLLAGDMFGGTEPFGEKAYTAFVWSAMTGGLSGLMAWNWNADDPVKTYLPPLVRKADVAAQAAMPALRNRTSDIALLYPFNWARGLPSDEEPRGYALLDWFNALTFLGREPEVLGEINLRKKLSFGRYRTLVAAHCEVVDQATLDAVRAFVTAGGTLYVTEDSFKRRFDDWRETDFAAFAAAHPDRVRLYSSRLRFDELMPVLKPLVGEPALKVAFGASDELPLVHRLLVGDATRKLLYFANYGGCDQRVLFELPSECAAWKLTPLVGTFDGNRTTVAGSYGIAAAVLESPEAKPLAVAVSPTRMAVLERVAKLNREDPADSRPKVLFPMTDPQRVEAYVGRELYPYLLDRLDAAGYAARGLLPKDWTPEILRQHAAVFLVETRGLGLFQFARNDDGRFAKMLADYVAEGGKLFVLSWTAKTSCAGSEVYTSILPKAFGVGLAGSLVQDAEHCCFGDPCQILTDNIVASPVTEGVRSVQLFALSPMTLPDGRRSPALLGYPVPVVKTPKGGTVCATLEWGKGRVFLTTDAMLFQPFRIEHADNAALLVNAIGWLFDKPVTESDRKSFKDNLFLTEKTLRQIAEEER